MTGMGRRWLTPRRRMYWAHRLEGAHHRNFGLGTVYFEDLYEKELVTVWMEGSGANSSPGYKCNRV